MQQFVCTKCGCVDHMDLAYPREQPQAPLTCTSCQGRPWHGLFPREKYDPDNDIVANGSTGIGFG